MAVSGLRENIHERSASFRHELYGHGSWKWYSCFQYKAHQKHEDKTRCCIFDVALEAWLNPKYIIASGGLWPRRGWGGVDWKLLIEEMQGKRDLKLYLHRLKRIPAKGRPGWSDTVWVIGGLKDLIKYWGWSELKDGGFSLFSLSRALDKTWSCKYKHRSPQVKTSWEENYKEPVG